MMHLYPKSNLDRETNYPRLKQATFDTLNYKNLEIVTIECDVPILLAIEFTCISFHKSPGNPMDRVRKLSPPCLTN